MSTSVSPQAETELTIAERDRIHQRNFRYFLGDYVLFTIALQMLGPSTVIPDFVRKLTDIEILIGMSSQIFDIGYLLPQLLIARYLVRVANKKWWFIGPNIPARIMILVFAGVILLLGPDRKLAMLIAFMGFYMIAALGDGLVGVPWMDLIGSSMDNARRVRMFGYGTAIVGILMLGMSQVVGFILGDTGLEFPNNYALLFGVSGLIFVGTIPIGLLIHELPGGKAQTSMPTLRDYLPQLSRVLRTDHAFRTMISARILMTLYTLAGPFYIGFATEQLGIASDVAVSTTLLMQTLGSVSGALVYSRWGNRHNLKFMRLAMVAGCLQPLLALFASVTGPGALYAAFFTWGIVYGIGGSSFTNWVLDYATPDQRPIYSGLFNTLAAFGFLIAPVIGGTLVELFGYEAAFLASLVMIVSALVVVLRFDPVTA